MRFSISALLRSDEADSIALITAKLPGHARDDAASHFSAQRGVKANHFRVLLVEQILAPNTDFAGLGCRPGHSRVSSQVSWDLESAKPLSPSKFSSPGCCSYESESRNDRLSEESFERKSAEAPLERSFLCSRGFLFHNCQVRASVPLPAESARIER